MQVALYSIVNNTKNEITHIDSKGKRNACGIAVHTTRGEAHDVDSGVMCVAAAVAGQGSLKGGSGDLII